MAPPGVRPSPFGIALILTLVVVTGIYLSTGNNTHTTSLRSLLIASIDVAEKGGDKVREIRERDSDLEADSKGDTKEGAKMLVTEGDFASNRAMVYPLKKAFPNVNIVSEERDEVVDDADIVPVKSTNAEVDRLVIGDEVVNVKDITVWIDPLDATQEYSEKLTKYVTTMVCIAVRGRPVIGVIHKPFERKTYWAWVKHGTNVDVFPNENIDDAIIVSRSHAGSVSDVARQAFGDGATVIPAGGAGYKTMALFNGEATVYVHTTLIKKWDICAGNAILDAMGGSMTSLYGANIDYTDHEVKNEGGVLAARVNHAAYLDKLGDILKGA